LHAAVKNPQAAAVEHGNGDHGAQIPSAAAEHAQTNNAPGAAPAHGDPSSFRGAAPEHVNDQPHFDNANPGNNGLGAQPLELPSQAALHAAVKNPQAAAVEHGNGDDAAQIPSAAAEHAQTNNAPGAASAHGDPSSFRGAAPEQVNDQPLFGDADPGNNGLGHQSRELPTQVAANAAAEIPSARANSLPDNINSPAQPTAGEDAKADHVASGHRAATDPSPTIDTPVAPVAHSDPSGLPGAASGDPIDQFRFVYANPGTSQSPELPSQVPSHPATDIPVSTTDNSADDRANDFNSPALPTADKNANGGDAAPIRDAAAKDPSTIDIAGATVADNGSASVRGAASGDMNDQFHFAYANPGNKDLNHQSLELPSQAASPAAVDIPPATTELAQILDDILTQTAQAPLDMVTAPGQNPELPWTNAHQDKPSNDFIIHA
jgi:hypothetical protein